jgi:hypothetical protein
MSFTSRIFDYSKQKIKWFVPETLHFHVDEETNTIFAVEAGPTSVILSHAEFYELMENWIAFYESYSPEDIQRLNLELFAHQALIRNQRGEKRDPNTIIPGFVYVLKGENGYYKIGKARNVDSRYKLLKIQLPFSVELIHTIYSNDYTLAEKQIHQKFVGKQVNGEWFTLTESDVDYLKSLTNLNF